MSEIDLTEGGLRSRCRQLEERLAAVVMEKDAEIRSLQRSLRAIAVTVAAATGGDPEVVRPAVSAVAAS